MAHHVIANANWKQDTLREDSLADVVRSTLRSSMAAKGSSVRIGAARLGLAAIPFLERLIHRSDLPPHLKEHLIGDPDNPLYGCADVTYYRWPDFDKYDQLPKGKIFLAHIRYWEMVHDKVVYVQAVVKQSNRRLDRENCGSLMDDSYLFTPENSQNPKRDAAIYAVEKRKLIDSNFFGEE